MEPPNWIWFNSDTLDDDIELRIGAANRYRSVVAARCLYTSTDCLEFQLSVKGARLETATPKQPSSQCALRVASFDKSCPRVVRNLERQDDHQVIDTFGRPSLLHERAPAEVLPYFARSA